MTVVLARDALGQGLNIRSDIHGFSKPLFDPALGVDHLAALPLGGDLTRHRFDLSGHDTIASATAVIEQTEFTSRFISGTYRTESGVTALVIDENGFGVACPIGPGAPPCDLDAARDLFVGAGMLLLQEDDHLVGAGYDDMIEGFGGNDEIFGSAGADWLAGGDGNDVLNGGSDSDRLRGDAGQDDLSGGSGDDYLRGGDDEDVLNGGAGRDRLLGGNDDDILNGNFGDDVLKGEAGDDTLRGGEGDDRLSGGTGADTFVFEDEGGHDVVCDFEIAIDAVTLNVGSPVSGTDTARGALLEWDSGSVLFLGVDVDDLPI